MLAYMGVLDAGGKVSTKEKQKNSYNHNDNMYMYITLGYSHKLGRVSVCVGTGNED